MKDMRTMQNLSTPGRPDRHSLTVFCILTLLFLLVSTPLWSRPFSMLETDKVIVYFQEPLAPVAREVTRIFPKIEGELESTLSWKIDFKPNVLLVPDRETFSMMAESSLFVAYALPGKLLIVIDCSRMNQDPFTLAVTLKHELCHLLLHSTIQRPNLPLWLDEGVCQWASGGFTELVTGRGASSLTWAALSGSFITLDALSSRFPEDEQGITLAYEESRSIVSFIVAGFGRNGILNILQALRDGHTMKDAVPVSLGITLEDLEKRWQGSQNNWLVLITSIMGNLYTILFIGAALLTIAVYLRVLVRKRRFRDEEPDAENL
jgi:hypothetical protein